MKYFIVTDVHSFYYEMTRALADAGFEINNPNHTFVSLGDLFDRGEDPKACLDFVLSLPRKILIRGNHEDLLEDIFIRGYFNKFIDYRNGTAGTVMKLANVRNFEMIDSVKNNPEVQRYFSLLEDYHETKNSVFVHGWLPRTKDWRNADKFQWGAGRWLNGMEEWHKGRVVVDKTVYCGHWHTSWGHCYIDHTSCEFPEEGYPFPDFSPFVKPGIVALDACTALSSKVNCYVIDDEELPQ